MERIREGEGDGGEPLDGLDVELLADGDRMNVQAFAVDPGARVPEHSHDNEQVGWIARGELTFLVGGEELVCGPGDSYAIPGGEPHAAENRGEETVRGVDVFSPPRTDPSWLEE